MEKYRNLGWRDEGSEKGRWLEEWKSESRPASSSSSSSSSWSELDEEWSPAAELMALFTPRSPYSSPEIQQPSETTDGFSTEREDENGAGVLPKSHKDTNMTRKVTTHGGRTEKSKERDERVRKASRMIWQTLCWHLRNNACLATESLEEARPVRNDTPTIIMTTATTNP